MDRVSSPIKGKSINSSP